MRDRKHKADLMKGNIKHALDPTNLNPLDRATHMFSVPTFGLKILAEKIHRK